MNGSNLSRKSKTLEDHQNDIEEYIQGRRGKIIDRKWKFIGRDERKTPYFLIGCDKECGCDCDERRKFWINKYEVKPSNRYQEGKWCPYSIINKSLNRHQMDIKNIVKEKGGTIIASEWKYIGKNKEKKPYYRIQCGGDIENNEKHKWWSEKNKLLSGSWCPKCSKGKSLEEHKMDIEDIVNIRGGRIIDMKWRYDKKNRKYPYFLIVCGGDNEENEKHQFWIYKSDLRPDNYHLKGVWCRKCQNKTLDQHQKDIEDYIDKMGGKILKHEWRYEKHGKYNTKIPYFYLECNNKEKKHMWWVAKGNLLPKPSNPTGSWCLICKDRIRAVSEYAHIIIEYYCLKYLHLINCHGRHESTLDEGSRPDLIIDRDDSFKINIEPYQNIISFLKNAYLNEIKEIAFDFTMSLIPSNILRKCFRNYQNRKRYLLIVLIREEGCITARYIQELINNDVELDNKENELIQVINFKEFLRFLNLDIKLDVLNFNNWNSLSKELREIITMFQKTLKLSIDAIESSRALEELKKLSEKCRNLLGIEFPNQKNEKLLNAQDLDNFRNQPSYNYDKFNFNQNDNKFRCSRSGPKKKRET